MNRSLALTISVLFGLVILGLFAFTYYQRQHVAPQRPVAATTTQATTTTDRYASITRINAKHFYQGGIHTLVGTVTMPTPCDLLNATATPATGGAHVSVAFTVINNAPTCVQQVTNERFKVTARAIASTTWSATFMGRPVILNIFPAAPGETPDSFQLFQKG